MEFTDNSEFILGYLRDNLKKELIDLKHKTNSRHVIHVRDNKGNYFIKFHKLNDNGGVDKITYNIGVHPKFMSKDDYSTLKQNINEGNYAERD